MLGAWIKANWKWSNKIGQEWKTNILGINLLKWTGMSEFNSDDHYIYYCGQESLRRNGVAIIVNKRVQNALLGCNLKNDRMIFVHFQGKPFNITVIQVYAPTSNAEETEVKQFYEDLQDLQLTPKKWCPLHYSRLECKSMKSRNTCKFGLGVQNEAGQRLKAFSQENTPVVANTLFKQHKRRLYTQASPNGQHQNQTEYILCSKRWRSSIQSAKTRRGADCDSDHELLIAKFRLKLKKVGKTTRPFRDHLNQIPYNYTVEVTNRFKGLDLTENSAWRTMDGGSWHCTGGNDQDHPQENQMQKGKMVVWGGLRIAEKKKKWKAKEKRKDIPIKCRVPKNSKER